MSRLGDVRAAVLGLGLLVAIGVGEPASAQVAIEGERVHPVSGPTIENGVDGSYLFKDL